MKKQNKIVSQKGRPYIVLGATRIIERLFGKNAKHEDITFKLSEENTENKTIGLQLYKEK